MNQPRVIAIALNYNGKELTLQTLASLSQLLYRELEIFVVDNGSSDGSASAIRHEYPQVKVLATGKNLGVAGGLNVGLEAALAEDPDYILVLNNDIEVDPWMLGEMVKVAERDPTIACVGPKAYYFWDRHRIWSAGGILRFKESITRERGMGQIDRGQYDEDGEVDYVNTCAMLIRASVVREVGLCDPNYFLALEDADWCVRMKQRGYRCYYTHRAVLWHMVSQSTGVYKPGRTYHTGRSTAIFVRRYAGPREWLSFLVFISLAIPAAFVRELFRGNQAAAISKARGILDGLRAPIGEAPSAPGG